MTSKRRILKDHRVASVSEVECCFEEGKAYEVELKRGYSFDPFADCRTQCEDTLRQLWQNLDLAYKFDGPYEY